MTEATYQLLCHRYRVDYPDGDTAIFAFLDNPTRPYRCLAGPGHEPAQVDDLVAAAALINGACVMTRPQEPHADDMCLERCALAILRHIYSDCNVTRIEDEIRSATLEDPESQAMIRPLALNLN